ncbi:MAG TPA: DUF1559 domain-containing protein [Pirellulales bacterium]|nr:DUF1559 domain-containing protein [Pirellulales bacterium]
MNSTQRQRRSGFTVLEAIVAIAVSVIVVLIAIPLVYRGMQSLGRNRCAFNLRGLGQALDSYQTAHSGTYPTGSRFQHSPNSPWGPSWWVELLPFIADGRKTQWQQVASSGDFSGNVVNPNYTIVDGLLPNVMRCPSSPLPSFNNPADQVSRTNRESLDRKAKGIALPDYVAIAGSAPDLLGLGAHPSLLGPAGRNTQDGPLGILSASGAFPPNQALRHAALRDGVGNVILVGEQSTWGLDDYYKPALQYDLRSCGTGGAYKGAGGDYGLLNPSAEGINGSGAERCFNITTVRYPINHVAIDAEKLPPGMIASPATEPPKLPKDKPPKTIASLPPGPGHNHGIFSVHPGGAHVLFADGRVEFKSAEMDLTTLLMLVTRDDGGVIK